MTHKPPYNAWLMLLIVAGRVLFDALLRREVPNSAEPEETP